METKKAYFRSPFVPYLLVLPQITITLVFFIWPAFQALYQSLYIEDPFGLSREFVWLENFVDLFHSEEYLGSFQRTFFFSFIVALLPLLLALFFAGLVNQVANQKNKTIFQTVLIWPYAVAPVVAGVLWWFIFNPTVGIMPYFLRFFGYDWNHFLRGEDAMIMVIIASTWRQISYNFIFLLAGMQAIPKSLIEAAAIDGSGPIRRFFDIYIPLLSPVTFFLFVINMIYAFFETFGVIHSTTSGGPVQATNILVYKVFSDGFIGQDLGGSAAQSVILMVLVIFLTFIQFRYVEKKVNY